MDNNNPSFAAVLASIRPKTDIELAEGLTKLIEAVRSTGKSGSIVARFDVKLVEPGGTAVIVNDKIALKLPEKTREGSIAWIGKGNRLHTTDPTAMPLFDDGDIDGADRDIHEPEWDIDPRTGEVKDRG